MPTTQPLGTIFKGIYNASDSDMAKLALATQYINRSYEGNRLISDASLEQRYVIINHDGRDAYEHNAATNEGYIYWDPDKAIEVRDGSGQVIGYESGASLLAHEMSHGADKNFETNVNIKLPDYDNMADKVAIERVNSIVTSLGELPRTNHTGALVTGPNPTMHSENGQWVEINTNGTSESSNNWSNFNNIWDWSQYSSYDPTQPIGDPGWDDGGWDYYGYYAATQDGFSGQSAPQTLKNLSTAPQDTSARATQSLSSSMREFDNAPLTLNSNSFSVSSNENFEDGNRGHADGLIQAMSTFDATSAVIDYNLTDQSKYNIEMLYTPRFHHAEA